MIALPRVSSSRLQTILCVLFSLLLSTVPLVACEPSPALRTNPWRFVVVGDLHLTPANTTVADQLVAAMRREDPELVLITGDLVQGGGLSEELIQAQLDAFLAVFAPLTGDGIPVYPVRGNREHGMTDGERLWHAAFTGALPRNGPDGERGLTYAVSHRNALFLALDVYVTRHRVNQPWVDLQLAANRRPHVFAFAHEPAFRTLHNDCLDDHPDERNAFWRSLSDAGARMYFCGHDHFFNVARVDDDDGAPDNELFQVIVGTGGAYLADGFSYSGDNAPYPPVEVLHEAAYGYLLVEISGAGDHDLDVTLTWKRRVIDPFTGAVSFFPAWHLRTRSPGRTRAPGR
jgi:hypothetical protein